MRRGPYHRALVEGWLLDDCNMCEYVLCRTAHADALLGQSIYLSYYLTNNGDIVLFDSVDSGMGHDHDSTAADDGLESASEASSV